jgi:predicted glycosyltransferase
MKVWVDCQSPCDVQLFRPFVTKLWAEHKVMITAQHYAETVGLLDRFGLKYKVVGGRGSSRSSIGKVARALMRTVQLAVKVPKFDICVGLGNLHAILVSRLRHRAYINFMDNEMGLKGIVSRSPLEAVIVKTQVLGAFAIVCPLVFPIDGLVEEGMSEENIFQFSGLKEDIYVADFIPDSEFVGRLPFERFVVVRPESGATYAQAKTIVPNLLKSFRSHGINVVYVPRDKYEAAYAEDQDVFIPGKALNGLDLCWHSLVTLTGSGTLGREAACMGIPAVSFYPGPRLLAVDQHLIAEGRMLHSRDVDAILQYVVSSSGQNSEPDSEHSQMVREEAFDLVRLVIESALSG